MNLSICIDQIVEQFGDTALLSGAGRSWSAISVRDASHRFAGALVDELAIEAGDRVVTVLPNCPEVFVTYFGVWRAGGTVVPVLPRMTSVELAARVAHSHAKVVVTTVAYDAKVRDALSKLAPDARRPAVVLLDGPDSHRTFSFTELVARGRPIDPVLVDDALALIIYTGGTTGAPKGVMISHHGFEQTSRYIAAGLPPMVALLVIPLAHIAGIVWSLGYLRKGDRLVLLDVFEARTVLQTIQDHRVEVMPSAPWMLWAVATHPEAARFDTSSMKHWLYASAPMPPHQVEIFERTFATRLHVVYGLTESSGGVTKTAPDQPAKPGSVGRVQPGGPHLLRIVDDAGDELPPGGIGEVVIGGAGVSPGYFGLPDETAETFHDGWLHTGDLGHVDDDGDLFLAGRKKELIITAGFNVYPAELEGVIADLPGVHMVSVIGVEDPELGERSVAFVAPSPGAGLTRDDVTRHCAGRLASYKVPTVQFLDRLPLTDTGKVNKRRLAELAPRRRAKISAEPVATPRTKLVEWQAASGALVSVQRRVEARVRVLLDLPATVRIASDQPLMDLGIDSLRAVQFRDDLADEFAVDDLSPTLVFDHPNVAAIAEHICRISAPAEAPTASAPPRPEPAAAGSEPIAIIGMACRLPGGVETLDALWSVLEQGRDMTSAVPPDRWDATQFDDPALHRGGFVDDLRGFDASLFGINSAEAESMDPQQRWLLETSWSALEHAGIAPDSLDGTRTGVVVGVFLDEYAYQGDAQRGTGYYGGGTGGFPSVAAGRIAYVWGLQGPCFTVDTACSSSLVAIHQACRALQNGEADLMLAGGVNAIITSRFQLAYAAVGALASDGRCKTFDERANGFGRSEGCAMICLKRLSDAERDGDNILAVVLGTSINHDGRASALTAPNGSAQEALLRDCLRQANVTPADVDYIEAHGTGTRLGDPIEVGALARVYGQPDRARDLYIGSLKSNIGHLESAAGAAALIKVVLMIRRGQIAPTIHVRQLNPHLPLRAGVAIATRVVPWRAHADRRRVAGVSSFGISGTNAHVLLAEPPQRRVAPQRPVAEAVHVAVISAKTPAARRQLAARHAAFLGERPSVEARDFCVTLNAGRARLESTAAVVGADRHALVTALAALARGEESADVVLPQVAVKSSRVAFVFTGQGAQYARMGHELFEAEPVFRSAVQHCAQALTTALERSLLDALFGPDSETLLARASYSQPAQFAISYGLAALWRSWGVAPAAVIGHSFGEYAAAVVAGVLSVDDALPLVAARGRLMEEVQDVGGMVAVDAPRETIDAVITRIGGELGVAAVNAPGQIVIAGPTESLARAAADLETLGFEAKRVRVNIPFHSPVMATLTDRFAAIARCATYHAPHVPFVATLEGRFLAAGEIPDAAYWTGGFTRTVEWRAGFEQLIASGIDILVEVSSHPVLLAMAPRIVDAELELVPSLRRDPKGDHGDRRTIANAVARLALAGVAIDWKAYERTTSPLRVEAPAYPFERKPYWIEHAATAAVAAPARPPHPLLGTQIATGDASTFEVALHPGSLPWLVDHRVAGAPVFPGTAYLEQLVAAADRAWSMRAELHDVELVQPLAWADDAPRLVQVRLERGERARGSVWSRAAADPDAPWLQHASAELRPAAGAGATSVAPLANSSHVVPHAIYARLERAGLEYGPWFRGLVQVARDGVRAYGEVALPHPDATAFEAHPAVVDACFHVAFAALPDDASDDVLVPMQIARVAVHGRLPARVQCALSITSVAAESITLDATILDGQGHPLLEIGGARFRRLSKREFASRAARVAGQPTALADVCFAVEWQPRGLARQHYEPRLAAVVDALAPTVLDALGVPAMVDAGEAADPGEIAAGMRALARWYVMRALAQLGWNPDAAIARPRLAARLGIVHTHRRMFERLLAMLEEDGGLPTSLDVAAMPPFDVDRLPSALAALVSRCGEALADVLAGRTIPTTIVADPAAVLGALAAEPLAARTANLVGEVVEAALASARGAVRILELTAGAPSPLAARLAGRNVELVVADVTALDLDRELTAQGFSPGYFDIVVDNNALHTARDLRGAVVHLRAVSAPGAIFVGSELLERRPLLDLTLGLLHGWWMFADRTLRDHPLVDETVWTRVLDEAGFGEVTVLPRDPGRRRGPLHAQGVLVARATSPQPAVVSLAAAPLVASGHWLLVGDAGLAAPVAAMLEQAGARVSRGDRVTPDVTGVVYFAADAMRDAIEPLLALVRDLQAPLWLVTRGADTEPSSAAVWGLGRVLANERPDLRCTRIDLEPRLAAPIAAARIVSELCGDEAEDEVVHARDGRHASRVVPWRQPLLARDDNDELVIETAGGFDGLVLQPTERRAPGPTEVELEVEAAGINFHDVLKVLGVMGTGRPRLGGECAGRVTRVGAAVTELAVGDRVVSVAPGSYARYQLANAALVAPAPPGIDMVAAASIPQAFLAAQYALVDLGNLARGSRVLVHAAAGGVGQAAVQIALAAGAEVYATASAGKHALVRSLGVTHVFDSRTDAFHDAILAATNGEGVDIALCSVAGELAQRTVALVRPGGVFVELGRAPQGADHPPAVRWASFRMDELARDQPALVQRLLLGILDRVNRGELRPLATTVLPMSAAADAFRAMAQGRHTGKLVLTRAVAAPAVAMHADATYLVTGGLGGLGLELATWLAARGAGTLVLASRRPADAATAARLDELRALGHTIVAEACDVADAASVVALFERMRALPPLRGIVHAAGIVEDAPIANHTWDHVARVLAPKLGGALHLREALGEQPVDFFVLFSSLSSVLGPAGQASYAAANAALDALARRWSAEGLPAIAIAWGAWDRVGMAARTGSIPQLARRGIRPLPAALAFDALERALAIRAPNVVVASLDMARLFATSTDRGLGCRFATFRPAAGAATAPAVADAAPQPAPANVVSDLAARLTKSVAEVLGVAVSTIDLDRPIAQMGLDSLVVVELRNRWRRQLAVELPGDWQTRFPTLRAVAAHLAPPVMQTAATAATAASARAAPAAPAAPVVASGSSTAADVVERVAKSVADVLGIPPSAVEVDRPVATLGLDSLVVVELRNRWRRQLGCEVPGDWPKQFATLRAVAQHIAGRTVAAPTAAATITPRLVSLAAAPTPIVCVHPAGGDVAAYTELARALARHGHAVVAIEYPTRIDAAFESLAALAREHTRRLRASVPDGPYRLLGWSVGGALAHAIAAELEAAGAEVELLCVVDPPAASLDGIDPVELLSASFGAETYRQVVFASLDRQAELLTVSRATLPAMAAEVARAAFARGFLAAPLVVDSAVEQLLVVGSHLELARAYAPRPVRARVLAIVPTQHAVSARNLASWADWSARRTLLDVDADHFSVMRGAGLDRWLADLVQHLATPPNDAAIPPAATRLRAVRPSDREYHR